MNRSESRSSLLKGKLAGGGNSVAIIVILVLFSIVTTIVNPNFMQFSNWMNIIRSVSVTGVMACALTFVMLTGNIDLSCGSILALSGCISCSLIDTSPILAIIVPIVVGALCGLVNGILVGKIRVNSFVVTLGMQYVIHALAFFYTNSEYLTSSSNGWFKQIGQGSLFGLIPYPAIIFIAVVLICTFVLHRTVFGAQLYMVGSNRECAKFSGINPTRMVIKAYVIGGAGIGLSSILLVSRTMAAQPAMGELYPFDILTAVIVGGLSLSGGKGNVWGTLLGVLFVGILSNGFTLMSFNSHISSICLGVALAVAVIVGKINEGRQRV